MWRLSLMALAGCNALLGVHDLAPTDAPADIAIDVAPIDAVPCIGSANAPLKRCGADDGSTVTLTDSYSTTTCENGTRDTTVTPPRCVIFAREITAQSVTVTGDAALVLFATDAIAIGTLDGSSTKSAPGPGAAGVSCTGGAGADGTFVLGNGGGGGGGGGSLATKGGVGGAGGNNAPGGSPSATFAGAFVPGCTGGKGGPPTSGPTPTAGGLGGGAIYLAANGSIMIGGHILANGAPGLGGQARFGGSGAGAGGSIFLDAPSITCVGSPCLLANGGGGGGGGGSNGNGDDGGVSTNGNPASGGIGGGGGAAGHGGLGNSGAGDGQFGTKGPGSNTNNGGGGGGGGAGQIVIFGTTQTVTAVPRRRQAASCSRYARACDDQSLSPSSSR